MIYALGKACFDEITPIVITYLICCEFYFPAFLPQLPDVMWTITEEITFCLQSRDPSTSVYHSKQFACEWLLVLLSLHRSSCLEIWNHPKKGDYFFILRINCFCVTLLKERMKGSVYVMLLSNFCAIF